jgi:hypothetical protein
MKTQTLQLPADFHIRLPLMGGDVPGCHKEGGWQLLCTRGRLWITQSDNARDHVLTAGHVLRLQAGPQILIGALEAAEIQLEWCAELPLEIKPAWRLRASLFMRRFCQWPSS